MRAADRQDAGFAWPVALRGDIYACGALPWGAPAPTEDEQEAEPARPKRAGRRAAPVRMPQSRRDVMRLLASGMDSPHEMARTLDVSAVSISGRLRKLLAADLARRVSGHGFMTARWALRPAGRALLRGDA